MALPRGDAVLALPRLAALVPLFSLVAGCVVTPEPEPVAPPPWPEPQLPDPHKDPAPLAVPIPVDTSRHLCDGREGLQVALTASNGCAFAPGGECLAARHGARYLLIDGQCNYWVSNPESTARTGRNGTIGPALRALLERDLLYQSWPGLGGNHCVAVGDASVLKLGDETATLSCPDVTEPYYDDVPPEFPAAFAGADAVAAALWDAGTDETGPVRIYVVRPYRPDEIATPPVPWPLASDPTAIAVDETDFVHALPPSTIVDDLADAATLRALDADFNPRRRYARDPIPVEAPDGMRYKLYVRDVLPFDDASGELGVPWQ